MKIYVDNREKKDISKEPIVEKFKTFVASGKCQLITEVVVGSYKSSDVHDGCGCVGVERKGTDFVPSIFSGLLDKQLKELSDNFSHPFLFLEFDGLKDMITQCVGVNPKVLIGYLTSVMVRHRVTIMFVGDLYVPFVCRVIEKFHDSKNKSKQVEYTPIRRGASISEIKLDIISRIPKVGAVKGNKLLEHFNESIKSIIEATEDEIMEVDGFGNKLSKQIKEIFS